MLTAYVGLRASLHGTHQFVSIPPGVMPLALPVFISLNYHESQKPPAEANRRRYETGLS